MPTPQSSYKFICRKDPCNERYISITVLCNKSDTHMFSVLCVKSNFYKNPALILNETEFDDIIVDGQYDGGVDFLLSDPNTEGADLVIGQSKIYVTTQYEDVLNAMIKMALFYKDMVRGQYEQEDVTHKNCEFCAGRPDGGRASGHDHISGGAIYLTARSSIHRQPSPLAHLFG